MTGPAPPGPALAEVCRDADAAANAVLAAAWPVITEHFARMALTDHNEGMRALVDAKTDLEARVGDLRAFERDYRTRLRAYLASQLADFDGASQSRPPDVEQIADYMRRTGWTPRRGRIGTTWERPGRGHRAPERIGMVDGMKPGYEHWQAFIERLAAANDVD